MKLDELTKLVESLTNEQKTAVDLIHQLYTESEQIRDRANNLRYRIQAELNLSGEEFSFLSMAFRKQLS